MTGLVVDVLVAFALGVLAGDSVAPGPRRLMGYRTRITNVWWTGALPYGGTVPVAAPASARALPRLLGVGRCASRQCHSALDRSVEYLLVVITTRVSIVLLGLLFQTVSQRMGVKALPLASRQAVHVQAGQGNGAAGSSRLQGL
jgi:hypothetical protein